MRRQSTLSTRALEVTSLAFHPDDAIIATGSVDGLPIALPLVRLPSCVKIREILEMKGTNS